MTQNIDIDPNESSMGWTRTFSKAGPMTKLSLLRSSAIRLAESAIRLADANNTATAEHVVFAHLFLGAQRHDPKVLLFSDLDQGVSALCVVVQFVLDAPDAGEAFTPDELDELRAIEEQALHKLGYDAAATQRRIEPLPASPAREASGDTTQPVAGVTLRGEPSSPEVPRLLGQFGHYRIERLLGAGGMGSVYLAYDTQLCRNVALKVLRYRADVDPDDAERFLREARVAAALTHPNLCTVHNFGQVEKVRYFTMSLIDGRSLAEHLKQREFTPTEAAALVQTVALALAEAHRMGVVHGDVKPANIVIDRHHRPVVVDFGVARAAWDQLSLTAFEGTPAYMAPERFEGKSASSAPSGDIYSLGVVLYELLTGRPPFTGDIGTLIEKALSQSPTKPSVHRPGLDQRLEAICLKAMAREPSERYASMAGLAGALEPEPAAVPEAVGVAHSRMERGAGLWLRLALPLAFLLALGTGISLKLTGFFDPVQRPAPVIHVVSSPPSITPRMLSLNTKRAICPLLDQLDRHVRADQLADAVRVAEEIQSRVARAWPDEIDTATKLKEETSALAAILDSDRRYLVTVTPDEAAFATLIPTLGPPLSGQYQEMGYYDLATGVPAKLRALARLPVPATSPQPAPSPVAIDASARGRMRRVFADGCR